MTIKNNIKLGKSIRQHRRRSKLTQEELAGKTGVTPKYIQYIESAKRIPSLKLLFKASKVLKVSLEELFKGL